MLGKAIIMSLTAISALSGGLASADSEVTILYTTDVHGHFFPYDFIKGEPTRGSLARVATAVDSIRKSADSPDNVLLFDNGDILQGQPTAYYYNFIDTVSPHIVTEIYRQIGYDLTCVGNHDIETGHPVYDRWRQLAGIPVIAANVIDRSTGQPYFLPYSIIESAGLRIAVIGLLTPAIPAWLPERLWAGLEFQPMLESARYWVDYVRQNETPDIVVGLFHSGRDGTTTTVGYRENESMTIARNVDGFDAVLMGHDHRQYCATVNSPSGRPVAVLNPANNACNLGQLIISKSDSGVLNIRPKLIDISTIEPSTEYMSRFDEQFKEVKQFVERKVTESSDSMSTREAFFGPSAFMTLIHRLQLDISGADISMAAPLTFDGSINKGSLTIGDMFTLYKYENTLCTLNLSGKEIKDYLEHSYNQWINQICSPVDHLIRFQSDSPTPSDNRLKNPSYNFDSAAGIDYEVDATKPAGERVTIFRLSDGRPFDPSATYTVAINSYRAGGGGNHLTEGAGISPLELADRIVNSTDKDLRYYMMKKLESRDLITADIDHNWKFVPMSIVSEPIKRDYQLLFGTESSKIQK